MSELDWRGIIPIPRTGRKRSDERRAVSAFCFREILLPFTVMKTCPLLLTCFLLSTAFSSAEVRTFTSSDGEEIEAQLLSVEDGVVLIERDDRRQFRVPIERLSEEDHHYVRRWPTLNALENERTVEITTRRLRLDRQEYRDAPDVDPAHAYRRTEEELTMQIVLNNRATHDLEDIHIEYRIFKDKADLDGNSGPRQVVKRGKLHLETLPSLSRTVLETESFVLTSLDRDKWGPYNPNTGNYPVVRYRRSDDFSGIWLRVMEGDKVIREVISPEKLSQRFSW